MSYPLCPLINILVSVITFACLSVGTTAQAALLADAANTNIFHEDGRAHQVGVAMGLVSVD